MDFEKMRQLTEKKGKELSSLLPDELTVLKGFAAYTSDQVVSFGLSRKASIGDIAVNAFRAGAAFGLGIKIEGGKVVER